VDFIEEFCPKRSYRVVSVNSGGRWWPKVALAVRGVMGPVRCNITARATRPEFYRSATSDGSVRARRSPG
jgi:hypothetical protein